MGTMLIDDRRDLANSCAWQDERLAHRAFTFEQIWNLVELVERNAQTAFQQWIRDAITQTEG